MAKRTDDDDDDRDLEKEEEEASRDEDDEDEEEEPAPKKAAAKPAAKPSKEPAAKSEEDDEEEDEEEEDDEDQAEDESSTDESDAEAAADKPEGEEDEEFLPAQLGVQRYVYATIFASILLGAYVLGRAIDGLWQYAASKDAVVLRAPWLSVADETKANYSLVIGGVLAALYGLYKYRQPSVRAWLDEVTVELVKVKWPSRKDVFNSTTVVLTTTAVAVVYLFLLDRFWGFVTNLIYGGGT